MGRMIIGIVIATVVVFMYGFAYWGIGTAPYGAWQRAPDDSEAQAALREVFPRSGTYFIPGMGHDPATREELSQAGPVVYAHVDHDGRPVFEPAQLVRGLGLNLAVAILLALVLRTASLPTYGARLGLAVGVALAAVVMIDLGDAVWWFVPLEWKLWQGFYNASAMTLAGAILAAFVRPD